MITEELIEDVVSKVEPSYLGEALLQELKTLYPGIRFTYCMEDDIPINAKPVKACKGFNIYFVDARNPCMCLTNDYEIASGVVLAEVCEDEDT